VKDIHVPNLICRMKKLCLVDRKFYFVLVTLGVYLVFILNYDDLLISNPNKLDEAYREKLEEWVVDNIDNLRNIQAYRSKLVHDTCEKYKTPRKDVSVSDHEFSYLKRVNWHYMYVAHKQSLVWCKVPKAGSSTWTYNFLKLAGLNTNSTKIHAVLRNYYPKQQSHRVFKDKFKFMVVRHPFERILSAYRDKLEDISRDLEARNGYYYTTYGKHIVSEFRNKKKPVNTNTNYTKNSNVTEAVEPTWREFITYIINTDPTKFDEHWMPISMLCSSCVVRYNVIAKMETFAEDTQFILEEAGLNDVLRVEWKHSTGTEGSDDIITDYYSQLSLEEMAELYATYQLDFQLYDYDPEPYFEIASDATT